jgi:hypothetical protein
MRHRVLLIALGLFIVCAPDQIDALEFVTDGLVSFWTFNENTIEGDIVMDVWGDNDGKMADTKAAAGKIGQGLEFNGSSSLVTIAEDESLDITDAITIEAWIYMAVWQEDPNRNVIMARYNADLSKRYVQFSINPDYGPGLYLGTSNGTAYAQTQLGSRKPEWVEEWIHLAATWDKSDDGLARLYANGVELEEYANQDQKGDALVLNDLPWIIGAMPHKGRFFSGIIDEVRIYDRRLSDEEILANFNVNSIFVAVRPAGKLTTTWSEVKR